MTIHGARLTGVSRRGFRAADGAMTALFAIKAGPASAIAPAPSATVAQGWIEIRADNTVLLRTGKCGFGQSTIYTAYRQIVAGELRADDMQWSTQSSAMVADIRIALYALGRFAA